MRKITVILMSALLCAVLAGCCLSHEWQEATCEAPKTCAKCGETEGEALGHDWQEVSCAAPKTCNLCGKTEGEALEHTLTEANYQQAATCTVCGAAVGEPLPAAFETLDIKGQWIEEGKVYDYVTACYNDNTKKTIGKLELTYMPEVLGDDLEEKEGYVWKGVQTTIKFSDENANQYGFSWNSSWGDYYSSDSIDTQSETQRQIDETGTAVCELEWNGIQYPDCILKAYKYSTGWVDRVCTWTITYFFRVPTGYDGGVVMFRDASLPWEDGMYINEGMDENTLMFRLK